MTTGTFTTTRTAATMAILFLALVNGHQNTLQNNLSYNANKNSFKCTKLPGTGEMSCEYGASLSENDEFLTMKSLSNEQSQLVENKDDWTKSLPLTWYTLGLILIFILQILICCGMVLWT